MTWQELTAAFHTHRGALNVYRGGLRRLRPVTLDRDSQRRFADFLDLSEAARRLPSEHQRIQGEMRGEEEAVRRDAAATARYRAHQVRAFVDQARQHIARTRGDVRLSFPNALDGVDPNGMIMLAVLRAQLAPLLTTASAATLLRTIQAAMARKDARSLVESEIIEDLVASGAGLAAGEADLAIVKQLREYVADVQDLRLPTDLPDFEALIEDVDRLDSRADAIELLPSTEEAASAAYEEQREAMAAAGAKPDAEDQAELYAELAS